MQRLEQLSAIGNSRQMNRCSFRVTPGEREGTVPKNTLLFCRICWKNTFDLLTNFRFCAMIRNGLRDRSIWAHSSAGRAPRSQCGGQGFDPPWVHQSFIRESEGKSVTMVADFSFLSPPQYAYAARQGSVEKWKQTISTLYHCTHKIKLDHRTHNSSLGKILPEGRLSLSRYEDLRT